jgi:hypothetical protein
MRRYIILLSFLLLTAVSTRAQVALDSVGRDPQYVSTIQGRASKIAATLGIDGPRRSNVENIIANHYFLINDIDTKYASDKNAHDAELYKHHFAFAADLANYIPDSLIEKVKDGLTYGVVPKTYQAHLEMIPSLKEEEKLQILNWLKEAREFAIDAGDSKAKHGWFGKYKGRINNWLSKRGYDLKAEREAWYKRIEQKKK